MKKVTIIIFLLFIVIAYIFGMNRGHAAFGKDTLSRYLADISTRFGNPSMRSINKVDFSICVFFDEQEAIGTTIDGKEIPVTVSMNDPVCMESIPIN